MGEGTRSPIPCPRPDFAVAANELLAALMLDDTSVEWPTGAKPVRRLARALKLAYAMGLREAGAGAKLSALQLAQGGPECRNV